MCRHKDFTVVAFGAVSIAQCDMCGILIPSIDVDIDTFPASAVDTRALDLGYGRMFAAVFREWDRLDDLTPDELTGAVREAWKGV